jgi:hypothetical protein
MDNRPWVAVPLYLSTTLEQARIVLGLGEHDYFYDEAYRIPVEYEMEIKISQVVHKNLVCLKDHTPQPDYNDSD